MNFYKILKIKKLGRGSPDFWTRLFAKHTSGGSVKPVIVELTGRLPLTFSTSDTKLHDWTIRGNNEPGKNLISVVNVKGVTSGVTITNTDEMTGSIEAETTSGRTYRNVWWTPEFEEGQTYILSCYVNEVNGHARLTFRRKSNDKVIASAWFTSTGMKAAQITYTSESYPEGVYVALMLNGSAATAGEINVSEIMLRKADTSEDFEPYQIGVGERTKNIFQIIPSEQIITETGSLGFTVDAFVGTIVATGTSGTEASVKQRFTVSSEMAGNYYFSADFNLIGSSSTFDAYLYDLTAKAFITKWNGTTRSPFIHGTESQEVLLIEGHDVEVTFRIYKKTTVDELIFKPMLRPANTTSDFIPYGYQIPLITMDAKTAEYVYKTDVFIGDSPLTEGESVSKSSTGLDIKTITIGADNYPNKLIASLSNKPEMTIKYKTKGGN